MNFKELNLRFQHHFPHRANAQQLAFFDKLAQFIYSTSHACFLLSGYAGTGKTTLVKSIVNTYAELNGTLILLAPTGRASKVLSQRTGKSANTIHRHIYVPNASKTGFSLRPNRHKHALFVVDEASMIANSPSDAGPFGRTSLLEDLHQHISNGHKCKVLFIGDAAQLPPVGLQQSPALNTANLANLFNTNVAEHELTQVIRQAKTSGILKNATKLRELLQHPQAQKPTIEELPDVVRLVDPYEMEEVFQNCFADVAHEKGIMIVRSNKRANQYNLDIRARIQFKDDLINTADQLMVVKNNYFWLPKTSEAGFIANGDTIEVLSLRNRQEIYGHTFADATIQLLDYPNQTPIDVKIMLDVLQTDSANLPHQKMQELFAQIYEDYQDIKSHNLRLKAVYEDPYYNALQVKFAHVVTCHKAQGGQWPLVVIEQCWLPDGEVDKEYLRWLYTAFTRAQEKVYLVGFDESFFGTES